MNCIFKKEFDSLNADARKKIREIFILIKYGKIDDYADFIFPRSEVNKLLNHLSGLNMDKDTCVCCEFHMSVENILLEFVKR